MNRVTMKQLDWQVELINELTNSPREPWTKRPNGKFVSNVGNYHIDCAYGGHALHRMINTAGCATTPLGSGYYSKRELLEMLRAFVAGLEQQKTRQD